MVDKSLPMRVEESNQCESPISIARERSSYSKRFVKLLQDFHHFIQKLDFLGLNTKVSFFPTLIRLIQIEFCWIVNADRSNNDS